MATLQQYLDEAQAYLTAQDVDGLTRNELLAHGALEKMLAALQGGEALERFNFDVGSLVRVAGQDLPFGTGAFRTFYSDGSFTIPPGVTSARIWVSGGGGSAAGPLETTGSTMVDGTAGGTTSVIGTGVSISATGGGAGLTDGTGGAGGVGSGGDENYTGGAGGAGSIDGVAAAGGGGGGAATQWGNGGKGGDAHTADGVSAAAGGGGSVFAGGDATEYGGGGGGSAFGAGVTPDASTTTSAKGGPDCTGGTTVSGTSFFPFDAIQKVHPFNGFWYAGSSAPLANGAGAWTLGHGGAGGGGRSTDGQDQRGGYANSGPGGGGGGTTCGASSRNEYGGYVNGYGGSGGGGGVRASQYGGTLGCGGGGGGGFSRGVFSVTPGDVLTLTVGAGASGHLSNGGASAPGFIFIEF